MKCSCPTETKDDTKTTKDEKKPFLHRQTILALSIGLPMGLTILSLSLLLLAITVKKCRKKPQVEEDFAGDLNEDYGVYYSLGERVEIESEVRDYNDYYEATEEQEVESEV